MGRSELYKSPRGTARKIAPSSRTCIAPQPLPCFASVNDPRNASQLGKRNQARGETSIIEPLKTHTAAKMANTDQPRICRIGIGQLLTRELYDSEPSSDFAGRRLRSLITLGFGPHRLKPFRKSGSLNRSATQRHAGEGARATQPAGRRSYLLRVTASYSHAIEGAVDEEERDQEEHQRQYICDGCALIVGQRYCQLYRQQPE